VSANSRAANEAAEYLRLLAGARDAWAAGGFETVSGAR
jgi:hypothetical protein